MGPDGDTALLSSFFIAEKPHLDARVNHQTVSVGRQVHVVEEVRGKAEQSGLAGGESGGRSFDAAVGRLAAAPKAGG